MQQTIDIAQRGLYTARPNPCVGCVIVDSSVDKVIASGWHDYYGGDHAEIMALKNLYNLDTLNFYKDAKNSKKLDVYITLEPCFHFGKTPPCVDALLEAKVGRVFIASLDPNPLVSSKSVAKLIDAGVEVKVGILEALAKDLNPGFLCAMEQRRCYVRVKTAISLDGKVAFTVF
jgi:diaminohydroxyphosphoribosylaminopyrimidine deaminase/5-amino-6-(5-phosphoribosylamino)uracil reductase